MPKPSICATRSAEKTQRRREARGSSPPKPRPRRGPHRPRPRPRPPRPPGCRTPRDTHREAVTTSREELDAQRERADDLDPKSSTADPAPGKAEDLRVRTPRGRAEQRRSAGATAFVIRPATGSRRRCCSTSTAPWSTPTICTSTPGTGRSAKSGCPSRPGAFTARSAWTATRCSPRLPRMPTTTPERGSRICNSRYYKEMTSLLRPLPGARELLEAVDKLGLQVVLGDLGA